MSDSQLSAEPVLSFDDNMGTFADTVGKDSVAQTDENRDDGQNPYLQQNLDIVLTRPTVIHSQTWNSTDAQGATIAKLDLLPLLFDVPMNNAILQRYRFFASDIKISIRLQSTLMHYGRLAVAWLPMRKSSDSDIDHKALFALDVNIMDAAKPDVLELTIPFMSPLKWWTPSTIGSDTGNSLGPQLLIVVLAPLGNAQSAAAAVPFTVIGEFSKPRLAGPVSAGGAIVPEFVIFQSEDHSGGMFRIDSERNDIREAIVSTPTFVSMRQVASVGQSLEEDTTVRLAMSSANTSDTSKKMVNALTTNEHSILAICKKPSLLGSMFIDNASPELITTIIVHPGWAYSAGTLTNAQVAQRLAQFYHGSQKYKILFTCAHVTTVRIAAYITYDDGTTEALGSRPYAIWDITGSMEKEIEVPFLTMFPYIPTWRANPTAVDFKAFALPRIVLKIVNPVTSGAISTVSPKVWLNIFTAMGDDFKLFVPMGISNHDAGRCTPIYTQSNPKPISYQDNLRMAFEMPFQVLGSSGQAVHIPEFNFQESFIDIKDLWSRYRVFSHTLAQATDVFTREIALPPLYRYLYRNRRYGARVKCVPKAESSDVVWCTSAIYGGLNIGIASDRPPWDLVPGTAKPPLQFEIPFNEAWYYDCRSKVYSSAQMTTTSFPLSADRLMYLAISGDSVFSFPTWAWNYNES